MSRPDSIRAGIGPRPRSLTADGAAALSDRKLLAAIGRDDGAASRVLVRRYLDRLVGFAYRLLGDASAAEDVAQETFLRLWRAAPEWRGEASLGAWLYRVAYNLCIDQLRRRRPTDDVTELDLADERTAGPFAHYHGQQVSDLVSAALAVLPARQRAAIALVHYQEMPQAEAAAIMGTSVDALESLLARGRRNLRDRLRTHRRDLLGDGR